MKKILVILFAASTSLIGRAQLVNSLNFSTGYNNLTNTTIPNGQQDPDWQVISVTTPMVPVSSLTYGAYVQNPWSPGPTTPANTKWISYDTTSMSDINYPVPVNQTAHMGLAYEFETCIADTIKFNAIIRSDNNITSLYVDGISTGFSTGGSNWNPGTSFSYSTFLNPGTHTVIIDVFNPGGPTGLNVDGVITSLGNSIIDRDSFPNYVCANCDDSCFWKVIGNTIHNGNNYFGTNSDDPIRIKSNNLNRGIINGGNNTAGGYLGWNTMNPTARLHVDCVNGNTGSGLSDIRFENLEHGSGRIMVINDQGYVMNSDFDIPSGGFGSFWNVNGNIIGGGANYLGTNSADNVILRTNNINKGILTSGTSGMSGDDGRLGWQTLNPTAHLHVNCSHGNPDDGSMGSDVRFERLEPGEGNILVIDEEGYIYNSGVHLDAAGKSAENEQRIDDLEKQIESLKKQIESVSSSTTSSRYSYNNKSKLFPNAPNPFGKETKIEYYIESFDQTAYITVNDLNGTTLFTYPIKNIGNGNVIVNADNLPSGIYLYSLIIDGQEIDTKRMVLNR